MPFLDTIQNAALRVFPEKKPALPTHGSNTGIGSGGVVPFEDDVSTLLSPVYIVTIDALVCPWCLHTVLRAVFAVASAVLGVPNALPRDPRHGRMRAQCGRVPIT